MERIEENLLDLVDSKGHFAPYAGGGGCYDFDAIYLLCRLKSPVSSKLKEVLEKSLIQILSLQQADGGFSENSYLGNNRFSNIPYFFERWWSLTLKKPHLSLPTLKQLLNLQRPMHRVIRTHWSEEHRHWDESNAWDSWFRMFTIAKISLKLGLYPQEKWHSVPFPGIGYIRK